MPRHDDRNSSSTRLYVGRISSRTRSRDLEDIFSKYGRVRDVDMKRDYAFVEFSDARDADDAKYGLNGREVDGSRITVEIAKGVPRGPGGSRDGGSRDGGSREYLGRGPTPGTGRCFNCGIEGHWARDCKGGDWKNKCYRCGDQGHIERHCKNSPEKTSRGRSYSRSPSPRRGRDRSRSYNRSRSLSQSRSPPPKRERSLDRGERRRSRSPKRHSRASPRPSKGRKHSPTPERRSPSEGALPSPRADEADIIAEAEYKKGNGNKSHKDDDDREGELEERSPVENNGRSLSLSPSHSRSFSPKEGVSPAENDGSPGSPRGSD